MLQEVSLSVNVAGNHNDTASLIYLILIDSRKNPAI
jgi:hypothetical protein